MKKTAIVVFVLTLLAAQAAFAANAVRISQVYGGGGNSGGVYTNDYIELFNSSGLPVNMSGWSLQYGSATGTVNLGACTNCLTVFPDGSVIPACGYWLIQLAAGAAIIAPLPVTPDLVVPQAIANNLSATAGKIALKSDANPTPCVPQSAFVDLVGYGATANCFETVAAGGLSNSTAALRNNGGMDDTDNNSTDFTVSASFVPRNSQSPPNPNCQIVATDQQSWGRVKTLFR